VRPRLENMAAESIAEIKRAFFLLFKFI
jgi:hypothetical protein